MGLIGSLLRDLEPIIIPIIGAISNRDVKHDVKVIA